MFSPSSKARLTEHDLDRFQGATLFDRIARATCEAGCLPRNELYETWEVARRVRRVFRAGRIIDLAAGHGLLAQILLILDDSGLAPPWPLLAQANAPMERPGFVAMSATSASRMGDDRANNSAIVSKMSPRRRQNREYSRGRQ